jgi:hypothetical protein
MSKFTRAGDTVPREGGSDCEGKRGGYRGFLT